jgi:hypothetical protein
MRVRWHGARLRTGLRGWRRLQRMDVPSHAEGVREAAHDAPLLRLRPVPSEYRVQLCRWQLLCARHDSRRRCVHVARPVPAFVLRSNGSHLPQAMRVQLRLQRGVGVRGVADRVPRRDVRGMRPTESGVHEMRQLWAGVLLHRLQAHVGLFWRRKLHDLSGRWNDVGAVLQQRIGRQVCTERAQAQRDMENARLHQRLPPVLVVRRLPLGRKLRDARLEQLDDSGLLGRRLHA